MTDPGEEVFKQIVAMEVAEQLKALNQPKWKRGLFWFMDHAVWGSLERITGIVLGFLLGALSSHPLLTYDVVMHWVKLRLP